MATGIDLSLQVRTWLAGLSAVDRTRIVPVIARLERHGPDLGRRLSKPIKSSQHRAMRELRATEGNQRILFAVDPNGRAQLLIGGDKTDRWRAWYDEHVPNADRAYTRHLRNLGKEGTWRSPRTGERTLGR